MDMKDSVKCKVAHNPNTQDLNRDFVIIMR